MQNIRVKGAAALFVTLVLGILQVSAVQESFSTEEDIEIEEADLSLTLGRLSTVTPGDTAVYTVTVTNNGPSDAENVVVRDYLSDDVSYVSTTPDLSCTFRLGDSQVRCDINTLAPSSTVAVTIAVKVSTDAVGTIDNYAEVYSDADDPNFDNDSDEISTKVIAVPPTVNVAQAPVQKPKTQQITIPEHVLEAIKSRPKHVEPVGKLEVISENSGEVINSYPDKIIIRNVGNGIADNIRVMLSPEIAKSFRLSETAIKEVEPNSNVTITLELNGNPNYDALGNMLGYKGNLMVLGEHHNPIFLPVNIGKEESYYLSSYMDNVASKAESRYNKLSLINSILSKQTKTQHNYEVKSSNGNDVIRNPSGEIVIRNLSDKELKNIRIELSSVGHPFLLEQNVIRSLDANGEINIKLISRINSERYSARDMKGELLLIPSNDQPIRIPIEIVGQEQKDSANEFEVRTISDGEAITAATDTIIIKNLGSRTMDSVKLMLSGELDRIFQLSENSFKTIESGKDVSIDLKLRSIDGEKKEAFMQDYIGELTIVSEHHNQNLIPIRIEWKKVSGEHFTIYSRSGNEDAAEQVLDLLEENYEDIASTFWEMNTKTVIYMASSTDEMDLINTDGHAYYSHVDDAIFVCSCDDPEYNSLKQLVYRLIINNYPSYHNMEKIVFDKENWLVDGIASYVAAGLSETASEKYLEAFASDTPSLQWYGYGSDAEYGATYTFFDYLDTKYGDLVIQKTLDYLGSGMISNHRCSTLENCVVLRAVYDMNGLDLDDKRHSLNFDGIVKEWQDYINQHGLEN